MRCHARSNGWAALLPSSSSMLHPGRSSCKTGDRLRGGRNSCHFSLRRARCAPAPGSWRCRGVEARVDRGFQRPRWAVRRHRHIWCVGHERYLSHLGHPADYAHVRLQDVDSLLMYKIAHFELGVQAYFRRQRARQLAPRSLAPLVAACPGGKRRAFFPRRNSNSTHPGSCLRNQPTISSSAGITAPPGTIECVSPVPVTGSAVTMRRNTALRLLSYV